jgi:hypothetical protein
LTPVDVKPQNRIRICWISEARQSDGRMVAATLRLEGGRGGQGDQPTGIARSTAATYLLPCWVGYLQGEGGQG